LPAPLPQPRARGHGHDGRVPNQLVLPSWVVANMTKTDHIDTPTVVRALRRAGIAGWAATVLLFSGVITMSSGGAPEPNFDAPVAEMQRYLETRPPTALAVGSYLLVFGLGALLWFVCGLSAALRRPGAGPTWLPTVVVASCAAR